MNKFISPALADLSQDIAGPIPVKIVEQWLESDQSPESHEAILAPYKKIGTIVSSDASGLSKLSAGRSLIEVMKLVSEPKEILHAHGKEIGGHAVGIWAADNTQMFYDQSIDVNDVVKQMVRAQAAIENVLVDIGIGIHQGSCFEIGGGLYGFDADTIEDFTEDESNAKEIIISNRTQLSLREPFSTFKEQRGEMQILDYSNLDLEVTAKEDPYYPAPFDKDFHNALLGLDITNSEEVEKLRSERVKTKTIVLFRIFHEEQPLLLNQFLQQVAANTFIHQTCKNYEAKIVKSNGTLAIIACDTVAEGVDLAIALQTQAKEEGFTANTGVAMGEVLIFEIGKESGDIAGGPVNIASKLAEDTNDREVVFFEESVADHARQHGITEKVLLERSGVKITGVKKVL